MSDQEPKWRGGSIASPNASVAPQAAELGARSLRMAKRGLFGFAPMLMAMTLGMREVAPKVMIALFLLFLLVSAFFGWKALDAGSDAAKMLKRERLPRDVPATLGQALGWIEITPFILLVVGIMIAIELDG